MYVFFIWGILIRSFPCVCTSCILEIQNAALNEGMCTLRKTLGKEKPLGRQE
jgi:hypothetical protein